ncbi:MAG: MFS transporter [Robiginitomaculum sp.]|nr:MAG: MFS transporter [Robiginitomaculum sp.]
MTSSSPHIVPAHSKSYRTLVMSMLVLVYAFNFLDRQIIGILAEPIKAEFDLSDKQMGLLLGPSFAILYAVLGVPIAWLADRRSRAWIMTIALTIWSGMTALCGVAGSFTQLFVTRIGVGIGEAGGVAPAYSLISDFTPVKQRGRALSMYSFGIPIGSAIGIVFGGVISTILDWRWAFIIVGLLGIAIAPIFRFIVREPKRGYYDPPTAKVEPASMKEVTQTIFKKPSFWFMSFGAASSSMMGYGLFGWMASYLVRSFGNDLPEFFSWLPSWMLPENPTPVLYAAYFYGTIILFAGIIGMWLGGSLSDKFGSKDKRAYVLVPTIAFAIIIPFYILGLMSNNLTVIFFALMIPTGLGLVWLGPVLAAIQGIAPPNMRASAAALFLLINNLIGIALGPFLIGVISDSLSSKYGNESLRYSILAGTIFYVIAAILLYMASRHIERDWEK